MSKYGIYVPKIIHSGARTNKNIVVTSLVGNQEGKKTVSWKNLTERLLYQNTLTFVNFCEVLFKLKTDGRAKIWINRFNILQMTYPLNWESYDCYC